MAGGRIITYSNKRPGKSSFAQAHIPKLLFFPTSLPSDPNEGICIRRTHKVRLERTMCARARWWFQCIYHLRPSQNGLFAKQHPIQN